MPVKAANESIVAKRNREVPIKAADRTMAPLRPSFGISMRKQPKMVAVICRGGRDEGGKRGARETEEVEKEGVKKCGGEKSVRASGRERGGTAYAREVDDDVVPVGLVEPSTSVDALLAQDEGKVTTGGGERPEERPTEKNEQSQFSKSSEGREGTHM